MFTRKPIVFVSIIMLVFFFAIPGQSEINVCDVNWPGITTYTSGFFPETWRFPIDVWDAVEVNIHVNQDDGDIENKWFGLGLVEAEWHFFDSRDVEMNVDGDIINITYVLSDSREYERDDLSYNTWATYSLSSENVQKIYGAEEITILVYLSNQPNITWDVPDYVLSEWKELFEMTGAIADAPDPEPDPEPEPEPENDENGEDDDNGSGSSSSSGCFIGIMNLGQ